MPKQLVPKPFYREGNLERNKLDKFEAEAAKENLEVVKNPLFF
jgi:hypothetical protein